METSIFAARVRLEREKRNLTQQELSRLCGFGASQINRYEVGSQEPSARALKKLSEVLSITTDYLVGSTDQPHGQIVTSDLDPHEREILDAYHREGWPGVFRLGAERMVK